MRNYKRVEDVKKGGLCLTGVRFPSASEEVIVVVRVNAVKLPLTRCHSVHSIGRPQPGVRVEVEIVGGDGTLVWLPLEALYEEEAS